MLLIVGRLVIMSNDKDTKYVSNFTKILFAQLIGKGLCNCNLTKLKEVRPLEFHFNRVMSIYV